MRYTLLMLVVLIPIRLQAATSYLAQIADGGGYVTIITCYNPSASSVTATLRNYNQNGSLRYLKMNGTTASTFTFTVPANGSTRLETSGAGAVTLVGWASLDSSLPLQTVATYVSRSGPAVDLTIGMFASSAVRRFLIPIDVSAVRYAIDSGYAIVNPSATNPITVKFTLINENGTTYLIGTDPQLNPLGPKKQIACFVTQSLSSIAGPWKGTLLAEVVGDGEMAVTALTLREGRMSAIPITDPDSLPEAKSYGRIQAERMIGLWVFAYSIISTYTDQFAFSTIVQSSTDPNIWSFAGFNDSGKIVVGAWSDALEEMVLIDSTSSIFNDWYTFTFVDDSNIAGCYDLVSKSGTPDSCYKLLGEKWNPGQVATATAAAQSQQAKSSMKVSDRRALGQNLSFDPVRAELLQNLKQILDEILAKR